METLIANANGTNADLHDPKHPLMNAKVTFAKHLKQERLFRLNTTTSSSISYPKS